MRSTKLISLMTLALTLSLTVIFVQKSFAFETDYEKCLFDAYTSHDLMVKKASVKKESDLQNCDAQECRDQVSAAFQGEMEKLKSLLNIEKKLCLKMSWN